MDEAALRHLVEEMRADLPDELRVGQRIAGERDRILADARAQARRIIEDAQHQANAKVDEQGVVQAARQRAREIQAEAEKTAVNLRDRNRSVCVQPVQRAGKPPDSRAARGAGRPTDPHPGARREAGNGLSRPRGDR